MIANSFEILVPNVPRRWRVVDGRLIQQSVDDGKTWATQYTADEKTTLLAGTAAGPATAWLVGRAGAVYVTTDGRTWRHVSFPERADLVAVTAADARTATVTTADKRAFTTTDAGQTWSARKN